MRAKSVVLRLLAVALCLCLVMGDAGSALSMATGLNFGMASALAAAAGDKGGITPDTLNHVADPATLDAYRDSLNMDNNSRSAGRIWTDKSVFANGSEDSSGTDWSWNGSTLTLTEGLAGDNDTTFAIPGSTYGSARTFSVANTNNADFLHVFSVVGSSQQVNSEMARPLDVVLLLDISESMCDNTATDPLHTVISEANELIAKLMNNDKSDPSIHTDNRVAVVGYGGGTQVLMELDHYENASNQFLSGIETYASGSTNYFPQITVNAQGKTHSYTNSRSQYMYANSTYLQGALYQGMRLLATESTTTYNDKGTVYDRQPILIVMTDGATNIVDATSTGGQQNPLNWWNPLSWAGNNSNSAAIIPRQNNNTANWNGTLVPQNNNPIYIPDVTDAYGGAVAPRTTAVLLTAGYMKKWVEANYNRNKDADDDKVSLTGFGIGLNVNNLRAHGTVQLNSTLNPAEYIKPGSTDYRISNAYDALVEYINSGRPTLSFNANGQGGGTWGVQSASWTFNHPTGTTDGAAEGNRAYDVTSIEDVYYIDEYMTASTSSIGDIFDRILETVTTNAFVPVSGTNDLGVSNALTFIDPIGKYMDVKDVAGILLFGHQFPVTRAGVYNYALNDEYMQRYDIQGQTFARGWYKLETGADGVERLSDIGPNYPGNDKAGDDDHDRVSFTKLKQWFEGNGRGSEFPYENEAEARANGWEFYFDLNTITQFVPNLKDYDPDTAEGDVKNITYIAYRFTQDTLGSHDDGNHLLGNPSYGRINSSMTGDVREWDQYLMNFSLTDIRIWVEDSGDWVDQVVSDSPSMISTEYDEALYISLPAEALPVIVARINLDAAGNLETDGYTPNNIKPLRVVYTVGMEEDLLNNNGQIDLTKVNRNYLNNNRNGESGESNSVYFYSNWYESAHRYYGYATDATQNGYSYGDAMLSFSPDTTNRYYMFQKNLPLYATGLQYKADGTGVNFADLPFIMGVESTSSTTLDISGKERQTRAGDPYTGSIDLGNSLSVVQDINDLASDRWYYIVIDYYAKGRGLVHAAIPRLGSELGSGIEGAEAAEYLVWYDLGSGGTKVMPYGAKPTEDGTWVVATAVGGPRVGAMAQNVSNKTGNPANPTSTAGTVFLPTVNANTDAGAGTENNSIVIDVYLGNNGRLEVGDTQLLVTKQLTAHGDGGTVTAEQQSLPFHYQVYVEGFEGAHDAVMVQYSPYSNSWQRRIDTIDVNTDNHNFLLDGSGSLAVFDSNGDRVTDVTVEQRGENEYVVTKGDRDLRDLYFVYLPETQSVSGKKVDTGSEHVRRIFINGESGNVSDLEDPENPGILLRNAGRTLYVGDEDYNRAMNSQPGRNGLWFEKADGIHPAGSISYWVTDAKLVPASNTANPESSPAYPKKDPRYDISSQLTLALLQPSGDIWSSDLKGGTTYDLSITYLTKTLYFGFNEERIEGGEVVRDPLTDSDLKDKQAVAANTACFTLKHNEGVLIPGIDQGKNYRVTEWLDKATEDFSLQQLTHLQDHTYTLYGVGENGKPSIRLSYGVVVDPSDTSGNMTRWNHNGTSALCQVADSRDNPAGELRHYMYRGGVMVGTGNKEINSATFGTYTSALSGDLPYYSASGQTSHVEEAAHFVNYAPNVLKDETTPGEGEGVQVGNLIEYDIYWENTAVDGDGAATAGTVVVEDPLDPGVDFVSASYNPENDMEVMTVSLMALEEPDYTVMLEAQQDEDGNAQTVEKTFEQISSKDGVVRYTDFTGTHDQQLTISYNKDTHTVTWTFNKAYAQQISKVHLVVRVNNKATENWAYQDGTDAPQQRPGADTEVVNRASVQVDENPKVYTEVIENPIGGPDKTETNVEHHNDEWGDANNTDVPVTDQDVDANLRPKEGAANTVEGPTVRPGDIITYRIDWQNTRMALDNEEGSPTFGSMVYVDSTVFIRDILDKNVEFVRAYGNADANGDPVGNYLNAGAEENAPLRADSLNYNYKKITAESPDPDDASINNLLILYNQAPNINDYPTGIEYPNTENANKGTELHTVFFVIPEAAANSYGSLYIDVRVKEGAEIAGYVDNQAHVQVENQREQATRIVENPVPTKDKEETNPGAGHPVLVGDEMDYEIAWRNETPGAANVVITDKLDPGVDFVSASYPYVNSTTGEQLTLTPENPQNDGKYTVTGTQTVTYTDESGQSVTMPRIQITYDPTAHTVTWTLAQRPGRGNNGSSGVVTLKTQVNAKAEKLWNYGEETPENPNGSWNNLAPDVGTEQDMEVLNRAGVRVGNQDEVLTKVVENPVEQKTETDPGLNGSPAYPGETGDAVEVGQQVTYALDWKYPSLNEDGEPVAPGIVTIVDKLDPGVKFVSAALGTAQATGTETTATGEFAIDGVAVPVTVAITYYGESASGDHYPHSVEYVLTNVPAGAMGRATLTVEVTEDAKKEWVYDNETGNVYEAGWTPDNLGENNDLRIVNQARFEITEAGNEYGVTTGPIYNPVGKPEKEEVDPGDGERVTVGQEIKYTVEWQNNAADDTGAPAMATVVITDKLDPGVDFVSAEFPYVPTDAEGMPTGTAEVTLVYPELTATSTDGKVTIRYYPTGDNSDPDHPIAPHTVVWTLTNRPANSDGLVGLTVRANDDAPYEWNYESGSNDVTANPDWKVYNQAGVQVGNQDEVKTKIVENPLDGKTETTVNGNNADLHMNADGTAMEGPTVHVGDSVGYRVFWVNDATTTDASGVEVPATAVMRVVDKLDDGVDFVSATLFGSSLTVDANTPEADHVRTVTGTVSIAVHNADGTSLIDQDVPATIRYYTREYGPTESAQPHSIEWILGTADHPVPAEAQGYVDFTVTVNENARKTCNYTTDETLNDPAAADDWQILNQGRIFVNNEDHYTNIVENPLGGPDKEESDPGNGKLVGVGDEITYEVTWHNDQTDAAVITVTDKLDPGVDFVKAANVAQKSDATEGWYTGNGDGNITYNADTHTVTWNIGTKQPGERGTVTLVVRVNENAKKTWEYGENPYGTGWTAPGYGEGEDLLVRNQAVVEVNNNPQVTREVENPVPKKEEPTPGPDEGVQLGDPVTYEISVKVPEDYVNEAGQTVQGGYVKIMDPLDVGLDFVSASYGDVTLDLTAVTPVDGVYTVDGSATYTDAAGQPIQVPVTISYYGPDYTGSDVTVGEKTVGPRTIVWTVGKVDPAIENCILVPGGTTVTVGFTATVNAEAEVPWDDVNERQEGEPDNRIVNRAYVVTNDGEGYTERIENPIYEPEKTETDPGDGNRVEIGDTVTYKVTWKNYKNETVTVIVTDKLDPGADFALAGLPFPAEGAAAELTLDRKTMPELAEGEEYYSVKKQVTVGEAKIDAEIRYYPQGYTQDTTTDAAGNTVPDPNDPGRPHAVVWILENVPQGVEGDVQLQTVVNANAAKAWGYGNDAQKELWDKADWENVDPAPEKLPKENPDQKIYNRAGVKVGNDSELLTNIPENPVEGKTETQINKEDIEVQFTIDEDGNSKVVGGGVQPDDTVTYRLYWVNDAVDNDGVSAAATVQVTDKLDPGVEFEEATYVLPDGTPLTLTNDPNAVGVQTKSVTVGEETVSISYYPLGTETNAEDNGKKPIVDHTVVWNLGTQAANAKGYVELTVKVNRDALIKWDYATEGADNNTVDPNGDRDYRIVDRGQIVVGNEPGRNTNRVENPTGGPDKQETNPGDGVQVVVGQEITYEVTWHNYLADDAVVVVTDKLDPGVDFVKAANVAQKSDATKGWYPDNRESGITYDAATHTVTWNLGTKGPGERGKVTLVVRVNENAYKTWDYGEDPYNDNIQWPELGETEDLKVFNQAKVQVGNTSMVTRKVENPVPKAGLVSVVKEVQATDPQGDPYEIEAGQFAFVVWPDEENPENDPVAASHKGETSWTVTNAAAPEGETKAQAIIIPVGTEFVTEGTYIYYVQERHCKIAGVSIDPSVYKITVVVTLNGDTYESAITTQKLNSTDRTPEGDPQTTDSSNPAVLTFTNAYDNDQVEVFIRAHKTLNGDVLGAGDFTFVLMPADENAPMPADPLPEGVKRENDSVIVTNTDGGAVTFPGIVYNERGTYYYVLSEARQEGDGIVYDGTVYRVVVTVDVDPNTNGYFATVTYNGTEYNDTGAPFVNYMEPAKEETEPGDGKRVTFGDTVTYSIEWKNYKAGPADVVITDKLDPGVDFKLAALPFPTEEAAAELTLEKKTLPELTNGYYSVTGQVSVGGTEIEAEIRYYPSDYPIADGAGNTTSDPGRPHAVVWILKQAPANSTGKVQLQTVVNEDAVKAWGYGDGAQKDLWDQNGWNDADPNKWPERDPDLRIYNRAGVKVDNDAEVLTNIPENPVEGKTETQINKEDIEVQFTGDGKVLGGGVQTDDTVTYRLYWENDATKKDEQGNIVPADATVQVADKLDRGVDFEQATYVLADGAVLTLKKDTQPDENGVLTAVSPDGKISISYYPLGTATNAEDNEGTAIVPHTVVWNLGEQAANTKGYVELTVKVNKNAVYPWEYGDVYGDNVVDTVNPEDNKIVNRGRIIVENAPTRNTNVVENPTGGPDKQETDPGDGEMVVVGQEITYEVMWHNYLADKPNQEPGAEIVVTDKLDPGVTYVSAGYKEDTPKGAEPKYDPDTHTVTWNLGRQPMGARGTVTLVVRVNADAYKTWDYGDDPYKPADDGTPWTAPAFGEGEDLKVFNQAKVEVDNDARVTRKVVNRVVEKDETDPGNGKGVQVGDPIHYDIGTRVPEDYVNDAGLTVKGGFVQIVDPLDEGLDFVGASYKGVALNPAEVTPVDGVYAVSYTVTYEDYTDAAGQPIQVPVTIMYYGTEYAGGSITAGGETVEIKAHTVVWTIGQKGETSEESIPAPADELIKAGLDCRVNEKALVPDMSGNTDVRNQALVYDNMGKSYTDEMVNPVYEPEKEETEPKDGDLVEIGETLTYRVTWKNYHDQAAKVTVTDKLDPGVDFRTAAYGDVKLDMMTDPKPELTTDGYYEKTGEADGIRVSVRYYPQGYKQKFTDTDGNPITDPGRPHAVVWILENVPAEKEGEVQLQTVVNADAVKVWGYGTGTDKSQWNKEDWENANPGEWTGDGLDQKIYNRAGVKVGDDNELLTEIPENPVEGKTETQINGNPDIDLEITGDGTVKGEGVQEDDTVTYRLYWVNDAVDKDGNPAAATVKIVDKLDPGVDFVSASYNGKTMTAVENSTESYYEMPLESTGASDWDDGEFDWDDEEGTVGEGTAGEDAVDTYIRYYTSAYPGTGTDAEAIKPHTVEWSIGQQPAGATGYVELTVRVNEKAVYHWEYGDVYGDNNVNANEDKDDRILNRGRIFVGNEPGRNTNLVENPTGGPDKQETDPGAGVLVGVGKEITYEITWVNDAVDENGMPTAAIVQIEDKLDPGVDFVKAANVAQAKDAADGWYTGDGQGNITYDKATHTVTWNLGRQPVGAEGTVTLVVKVNDKAVQYWDYDASYDKTDSTATDSTKDNDLLVRNQAKVQVGNEAKVTRKVENPVPEKKETAPGDGQQVKVGDRIDYEVSVQVPTTDTDGTALQGAVVTVTDPLDVGMTFVEASYGDVVLTADAESATGEYTYYPDTRNEVKVTVTITYDAENRVVKWIIGEKNEEEPALSRLVPAGVKVTVTLTAEVNESAPVKWDADNGEQPGETDNEVNNRARVAVNDAEGSTNTVHNPVGQPEKTETKPGTGLSVAVGDEITYEVTWRNYKGETANVVITDKLDPGVTYVSAGYKEGTPEGAAPKYDADTHTVTWTLENQPKEAGGAVTLTVKVNEKAFYGWNYDETVENPDGWSNLPKEPDRTVEDRMVYNRAGVKVGNDAEQLTDIPWNPLDHKTEVAVGERQNIELELNADGTALTGPKVAEDDRVTYRIYWANDAQKEDENGNKSFVDAVMQVVDKLDPGAEFVQAVYVLDNSVTLALTKDTPADENGVQTVSETVTRNDEEETVSISYYPQGNTAGAKDNAGTEIMPHTVVWNLGTQEKNATGYVELTVQVNANASYDWSYGDVYGDDTTLSEDEKDQLLKNRGRVLSGEAAHNTNAIENPTGGPDKTEVTPGEGVLVGVGEEITYEITWENDQGRTAEVVITDKLDPGVDYVSAGYKGDTPEGAAEPAYDETTHTVTWNLGKQPKDADGVVTLTVQVNDKAAQYWDYNASYDETDSTKTDTGRDSDLMVRNQAKVQVGNTARVTRKVENPVPEKKETAPGDGTGVQVGDRIDYEVSVQVPMTDTDGTALQGAVVTVTDPLDIGLTFVEASYGEIILTAESASATGEYTYYAGTEREVKVPVTVTYDAESRTVVWTIGEKNEEAPEQSRLVPAGVKVTVKLTAEVNENAPVKWDADNGEQPDEKDNEVINRARVAVNDAEGNTNTVRNPVGKPEKTEVTPGNGVMVDVGKEITYEITWENYKDGEADVVVRDKLDPGVDFVIAGYKDGAPAGETPVYDAATHTVTWTLKAQPAGANGTVTLTVKVNDKAHFEWSYADPTADVNTSEKDHMVYNRASVQVGNDSEIYTDVVENPLPYKEETTPGAGETVSVGQEISYEIYWQSNAKTESGEPAEAEIVITDKLDPGVDFVAAGYKAGTPEGEAPVYDAATHTVTWKIGKQAFGMEGIVTLTVRVNEQAELAWSYENPEAAPTEDKDLKVLNRARITVNESDYWTDVVENPTGGPTKTEVTPGAGVMVDVGKEITYEITWENYKDGEADVVVRDKLDPGVDFVIAGYKDGAPAGETPVYDASTHTVTWTLKAQPAGANGTVTLTVKVNDKAHFEWSYADPTADVNAAEKDHMVYNRASVQVGNDSEIYTDIVENPLPYKEEVTPGAGETVSVGQEIAYRIHWQNNATTESGEAAAADVVITDKLDPGVDFVSAGYGEVKLTVGNTTVTEGNVSIAYDAATHTVTWTLKNQAAKADDYVDLTVRVNEQAELAWSYENPEAAPTEDKDLKVLNRARITVNESDYWTDVVENPTGGPTKTEVTPGNGVMVDVGKEITYEITWENYKDGEADVVVRDKLDPGVDFVIAGYKDGAPAGETPVYDAATHTVTWTLKAQPAGANGTVTLTVKVNDKAHYEWTYADPTLNTSEKDHMVYNRASVQVGNDSEIYTDIVENPLPDKTETQINGTDVTVELGQDGAKTGRQVQIGDTITYQIAWTNGHDTEADVIISDILDKALDFVSADNDGQYSEATRTVVWTLHAKAHESGFVTLTVKVNDSAKATEEGGYEIVNKAAVRVGDDPLVETSPVENPTPGKTETKVNDGAVPPESLQPDDKGGLMGPSVEIGDTIEYRISFRNSYDRPAKITVKDPLDPGVDFVSAAYGDVTLTADGEQNVTVETETVSIAYDAETRTVTWTLKEFPANTAGYVTLTVRVNEKAPYTWNPGDAEIGTDKDDMVRNQASVQIDDEPEVKTEIPDNPVGEPKTGSLTVTKTVTGEGADETKAFTFTVRLSDVNVNGTYGDMTFVSGVASFTLKHGESKKATGLPAGVHYTVIESLAEDENYTASAVGDTGVIEGGKESMAAFLNTFTPPPDIPKTGDRSHPEFWMTLSLMALLGLAWCVLTGKKRSER